MKRYDAFVEFFFFFCTSICGDICVQKHNYCFLTLSHKHTTYKLHKIFLKNDIKYSIIYIIDP